MHRDFLHSRQASPGYRTHPRHFFEGDPDTEAEWLGEADTIGIFHVTTALQSVLRDGALYSRKQLRARGVHPIGLGGGARDLGADRLSVVLTLEDALRIERGMLLMVDAIAGVLHPGDALSFLEDDNRIALSEIEPELDSRCDGADMYDPEDGWAAQAGEGLAYARSQVLAAERGPALYEAIRAWEACVANVLAGMPEPPEWVIPPRNPISFCMPVEQFSPVRPEHISVIQLAVEKGCDAEQYPREREMRLRPECLEIIGAMRPLRGR